jgi:hypothetical protein
MVTINNIDDNTFSVNGITYNKNFQSVVYGNNVEIQNLFDSKLVLIEKTNYADFTVNSTTYGSAASLQSALLTILNNRSVAITDTGDQTINGTLTIIKSGADAPLLRLNTERPWEFRQGLTGATSSLDLVDLNGFKIFNIKDLNGLIAAKFGATGGQELYYNNVKKFETTSAGVTVTGKITSNTLNLSSLPTSALGLSAGDIWNDAGTLKIV